MRWRITLEVAGTDGRQQVHEVGSGERSPAEHAAATLGLGLEEGKAILAAVQRHLVAAQVDEHCRSRRRFCYGFVGNRMLAARSGQVERLLLEGALPQEIDAAITGFGFRMGPCAKGDLAGLDIGWRIREATGKRAPVADALCEAGRLGQKTGKGYYRYAEGAEVTALIERIAAEKGVTRRAIGAEEIVERLIYPMINEGARILEEGIAARPGDIDVVWLNGYGWPAWRGGPMFYADQVGLVQVAARLADFAASTGDASLRPAPLLRRLADEGRGFASPAAEKAA
jgi:3-hydroxyacyl-CoA dehydrogenase